MSELLPLAEVERRHVLAVLDSLQGNIARAARALDIDRRTLYRKLHSYGFALRSSWVSTEGAPLVAAAPLSLISDLVHIEAPDGTKPDPRILPEDNESVRTIRALQEQIKWHAGVTAIAPKETT